MPAEHVVDLHLRELDEAIRFAEATALLMRQTLMSPPASTDALVATIDSGISRLLNTLDEQLATLAGLKEDIAELRIAAHGSRRRKSRP